MNLHLRARFVAMAEKVNVNGNGAKYGFVVEDKIMAYKASHRYARISARKVRPLAALVRGKPADEALNILRFQPQRGARMLEKVIRSALGNAQDPDNPQNKGRTVDVGRLVISEAHIDGGPMIKRIRPRARGMAYMIQKRMSHINVTLDEV